MKKNKTLIGLLLILISFSSFTENKSNISNDKKKIEKISVNDKLIQDLLLSTDFKSLNLKIDEKSIVYLCSELSISIYVVNIIDQPDNQIVIYKKADGAVAYAINSSKTLENGNKELVLTNIKGKLYYSLEVNKSMKIGNFKLGKTEDLNIKFTKFNTYNSYSVLSCVADAMYACSQEWYCNLMCISFPNHCLATTLAICIAQEA